MDYFAHSADYLLAELERVELLIYTQVARVIQLQIDDEQFRGLYNSEQELDALLKQASLKKAYGLRNENLYTCLQGNISKNKSNTALALVLQFFSSTTKLFSLKTVCNASFICPTSTVFQNLQI